MRSIRIGGNSEMECEIVHEALAGRLTIYLTKQETSKRGMLLQFVGQCSSIPSRDLPLCPNFPHSLAPRRLWVARAASGNGACSIEIPPTMWTICPHAGYSSSPICSPGTSTSWAYSRFCVCDKDLLSSPVALAGLILSQVSAQSISSASFS